jgi:hypothetical protein
VEFCTWKVIVTSSFVDVVIISILAYWGILMKPLSINILFGIFAAAAVLALVLDQLRTRDEIPESGSPD